MREAEHEGIAPRSRTSFVRLSGNADARKAVAARRMMDLRGNATEALEREVQSALAEASVYDVSSYGWLNENDDLAQCELEELDALDGIEPQHAGQIVQGAGRHMDSDVSARARCTQVTLIPAKCALLRAPNRAF